ncbi:MAG: 5-formyltetrahydrofolate cyclo-ligase [Kiloniellales bacterium]
MPAAAGLGAEKQAMRTAALKRREAAFAVDPDAGERLAAWCLEVRWLAPEAAVSAYWPKGSELDPRPLMHRLHERGHVCLLPVMVGRRRPLVFRRWHPGARLVEGGFRVLTPGPEAAEGVPDVVLCPLLAFDRRGYRLGYGGGYYDRTLHALRRAGAVTAIGIGYAAQEVPAVPHNTTDQPLDGIVTEAGPIVLAVAGDGG